MDRPHNINFAFAHGKKQPPLPDELPDYMSQIPSMESARTNVSSSKPIAPSRSRSIGPHITARSQPDHYIGEQAQPESSTQQNRSGKVAGKTGPMSMSQPPRGVVPGTFWQETVPDSKLRHSIKRSQSTINNSAIDDPDDTVTQLEPSSLTRPPRRDQSSLQSHRMSQSLSQPHQPRNSAQQVYSDYPPDAEEDQGLHVNADRETPQVNAVTHTRNTEQSPNDLAYYPHASQIPRIFPYMQDSSPPNHKSPSQSRVGQTREGLSQEWTDGTPHLDQSLNTPYGYQEPRMARSLSRASSFGPQSRDAKQNAYHGTDFVSIAHELSNGMSNLVSRIIPQRRQLISEIGKRFTCDQE